MKKRQLERCSLNDRTPYERQKTYVDINGEVWVEQSAFLIFVLCLIALIVVIGLWFISCVFLLIPR